MGIRGNAARAYEEYLRKQDAARDKQLRTLKDLVVRLLRNRPGDELANAVTLDRAYPAVEVEGMVFVIRRGMMLAMYIDEETLPRDLLPFAEEKALAVLTTQGWCCLNSLSDLGYLLHVNVITSVGASEDLRFVTPGTIETVPEV